MTELMAIDIINRPGQFARERFRSRRRAWLRRVWWVLPVMAAIEVGSFGGLAAVFMPEHVEFFLGAGCGAALATVFALIEMPPHHIERWRQGADGERATGRQLRRL